MLELIIFFLFLGEVLYYIYFHYRGKKENEEFRCKLEKENEELRCKLEKETEEMQRMLKLFSEDTKIFLDDNDFKTWYTRIMDLLEKNIYETVLAEYNTETKSDLYCTLKEYEEWRTQKN